MEPKKSILILFSLIMTGPNTRKKNKWDESENQKLIKGINKYWEVPAMFKSIERDPSLEFTPRRTNVNIKDRFRIIYPNFRSVKGFFVPENAIDPKPFIFEEDWHYLNQEDSEIRYDMTDNEIVPLNFILYKYSTSINNMLLALESLPEFIDGDPMINSRTWIQFCDKFIKGENNVNLSLTKKAQLLDELLRNQYVKAKIIGKRTFVLKY